MSLGMSDDRDVIRADPSKAFFIDMLTRDIAVVDCILDLVDNAVDKAIDESGLDAMTMLEAGRPNVKLRGATIAIELSDVVFGIQDTCGGITSEDAANDVFLFGNPSERGAMHGLSVYGIGMKRAMFKIGDSIQVESHTKTESFRVDIDVPGWKRAPDWEFQFSDQGVPSVAEAKRPGTTIVISDLRPGIGERLGQATFHNDLRAKIGSVYALFIHAGLIITVNGREVPASLPVLAAGPFTSVRKSLKYGGVDILIIAGITPKEDRGAHGWYVFCNGRMVVQADKTQLTGWGDGTPQFRSKYNHFLGMVFLSSKDVRQLPFTTTKQGVEKEAPVYQAALLEMRVQSRPILDFLNDLYPSEPAEEAGADREAFERAAGLSIEKLARRETSFSVVKATRVRTEWVSIQYSRLRKDLDRIMEHVGRRRMSASKIGEMTFDYYVTQELD